MNAFSYAYMTFLLVWPWSWPDDLDIRISPGCFQNVPAYQEWSL